MILKKQTAKILTTDPVSGMKMCEYAGRNCYASHDKITQDSYKKFLEKMISNGHEVPLEFQDIVFEIETSRAVLAELSRHRLASLCVESQRYIQEAKTGDITFIFPQWYNENTKDDTVLAKMSEWKSTMQECENAYKEIIAYGAKPEEAREVLPNSTACKIIIKANLREWRHIFELRCSKAAYPQMRELMLVMLDEAYTFYPVIFEDLHFKYLEN